MTTVQELTENYVRELMHNFESWKTNFIAQFSEDNPEFRIDLKTAYEKYTVHLPNKEEHTESKTAGKEMVNQMRARRTRNIPPPSERCLCIKKDGMQCTKRRTDTSDQNNIFCTVHNKYLPDSDKIITEDKSGTLDVAPPPKPKGKRGRKPKNPGAKNKGKKTEFPVEIDTSVKSNLHSFMGSDTEPQEIIVKEDENGNLVDPDGNIFDLNTQQITGTKDLKTGDITWLNQESDQSDQVGDQVSDQVGDQVGDHVGDQVASEPEPEPEQPKAEDRDVTEDDDQVQITVMEDADGDIVDDDGNIYDLKTNMIVGKKDPKTGEKIMYDDPVDPLDSTESDAVEVFQDEDGDYVDKNTGNMYNVETGEHLGVKDQKTGEKSFFNKNS